MTLSILSQTWREGPHSYSTTPTFSPSVRCFFEGEGLEMSIVAIRIDLEARVKAGGSGRSQNIYCLLHTAETFT